MGNTERPMQDGVRILIEEFSGDYSAAIHYARNISRMAEINGNGKMAEEYASYADELNVQKNAFERQKAASFGAIGT